MALSIGGLGSGLDTASIIAQLMATERIPQGKVQAAGQAAQKQSGAWSELRTKVLSLLTSAEALRTPAKAVAPTATSSNPAVRVTAGERATPGQTAFVVTRLATAQQKTWSNVGPADGLVGAGRTVLASGSLGSSTATPTAAADALDLSGASAGAYNITVTRGSSAATAYLTAPTAASPLSATDLVVTGADGTPRSVTLRSDYADAADMVTDLKAKLGEDAFRYDVVGGRVQIRSADEGASQSLTFSGGAATALGLPTEAVKGQNAVVTVNGKRQEIEPEPAGSGTVDVELGDTGVMLRVGESLRPGTLRANVVETDDDDTLGDLVSKLNASGSPVSASLTTGADGRTTLTTTATATGPSGAAVLLPSGPAGARQPLFASDGTETVAAQKASLQIGGEVDPATGAQVAGRGGTVHQYDSNTITELVPGVTFELLYKPPLNAAGQYDTVSTAVSRDSSGTKDKVKSLVDAMNGLLNDVKTKTKYDVGTRTGGPLVGNGVARGLTQQLFAQTAALEPSGDLRSLAQVGISTTRDGTFELDTAVLTKALEASPDDVARVVAGMADKLATWAKDVSKTGGPLTIQRDGADAEVTNRRKQSDAMDARLQRVEERYRKQFAALDTAMSQLNSQRAAMSGALGGLL